ncbi:MAG: lysine--tRNA ligase [Piscirickettsiaceae bacterium CG_4_9_14_3_um_filter_43_564]|nr:lysine--tRNA ligase [Thiomicrospira sp.]OIP93882.1 MAG: lysine--tRNA ligase [Thiomicrospira sp. CG2_30_44_34]PIQ04819.1 MAG: lysine--tRNA ligase [Piscirickettsiaceae bacterium CG18_big_fil_WC_8_21_14_2_50_44_103]PIU37988.1 MAG: lysine--tRNA ligase [Piscirickettsiaceae bacterium CG07_land_8_20_14_0_80_44_28]PIW56708.1 MAG: lysine--tRNA ligase [Piscirickettsiaceae bacterium CG12_big_fil_rev_8_21_14_0_65_44_934]PIW78190.1 MAG: lysine--tRNA ligase [Piscirickettsiaceae bacterium CG_4_8_14_3_um_f
MANVETPEVDENKIIAERRAKLTALREMGQAYPNTFRRNDVSSDLHEQYDALTKEQLAEMAPIRVKVAGRMMMRRIMGKASFATLQDTHGRIQLYVTRDELPEGFYNSQFKKWDLGDIVGAEGYLFKTNTGELSVHVQHIELITKSLRPLPDKFHGLQDQEVRYRQRYVDLIVNEESRDTFVMRSKIVQHVRTFLIEKGFMEVETPMMHVIPGGATAKPFNTHHNALDMPLYLRIAPELYLKRLVVGGFEKVFEINRSFRNEGLSTRHNPEFTMVEFYSAYTDYHQLMDYTEELLKQLAEMSVGSTQVPYQGQVFDFGKPFARLTMKDAILKYNPSATAEALEDLESARALAKSLKVHVEDSYGLGKIWTEIFEETAEEKLMDPTFIIEYPAEVSPLARRNDDNPFITDRFELFIGGRELANGFNELNDAEDQAERFKAQVEAKDAGDDEAMHYDEDYITALEHGMPPTAGEGIGIDRLVMLFTDKPTIRDVLLFPHMRQA